MVTLPISDDGGGSGVELLERAIGYTRGALVGIRQADLCLPTPCTDWRLASLLAHMEDALDAFAEGAAGRIDLTPAAASPLDERVTSLQDKACRLLGDWAAEPSGVAAVGDRSVPVALVSRVAALEVVTHGWDVTRTTGRGPTLTDELAEALLPTAVLVVREPDGFAPPLRASYDTPADRLLALLGRDPAWNR